MGSKAATGSDKVTIVGLPKLRGAVSGRMTLQEWQEYTGTDGLGVTLSHGDLGHQNPIDAAMKCPHGQYSALFCVFCGDLRYDEHCKVTSETSIERKEIICEWCVAKGKEKCACKRERRYKFVGEDEWGENFEIRPSADETPVLFQAQMLGPQIPPGRPWQAHYTENHFKIAFLYWIHFSVSWRSLLHFKVVKFPSKCAKPKDCKYPLSHGHPTIESIHATKIRAGFSSFVDNPVIPRVRKSAITPNEVETRWCREMQFQPFEPWLERVYAISRVRSSQGWVTHDPFPRRGDVPYLEEWAALCEMRSLTLGLMPPTVTILRRPVPGDWKITYRVGSRPKAGKPMNLSKRSLMKIRVRLKIKDMAALWNVSERTARRRLAEMRDKPYARLFVR